MKKNVLIVAVAYKLSRRCFAGKEKGPGSQPGFTTPPSGGDDDKFDAEFEVES